MQNTIIYLIGFPAAGKYSIAKEICARDTDFRLVDNHLINNPVLNMLDLDGKTKIPARVWDNIDLIWQGVCDTIINYSSKEASFVVTNVLLEGEADDAEQYERIKNVANKRGAKFIPVILECSLEELSKRIVNEGRKERQKMTDVDGLHAYYDEYQLINIEHDNLVKLDNTNLSVEEVIEKIWNEIK